MERKIKNIIKWSLSIIATTLIYLLLVCLFNGQATTGDFLSAITCGTVVILVQEYKARFLK